jgi:hypothetical protein
MQIARNNYDMDWTTIYSIGSWRAYALMGMLGCILSADRYALVHVKVFESTYNML